VLVHFYVERETFKGKQKH